MVNGMEVTHFSDAEWDNLIIVGNSIYEHKTLSINYMTYDLHHDHVICMISVMFNFANSGLITMNSGVLSLRKLLGVSRVLFISRFIHLHYVP